MKVARREVQERWWAIIGAALVAALVVAGAGSHLRPKQKWLATTTLIAAPASPSAGVKGTNTTATLEIGQSLVTNPDVIKAAEAQLTALSGKKTIETRGITTAVVRQTETLTITVQSPHAVRAAAIAAALGKAVVAHLQAQDLAVYQRQVLLANQRVAALNGRVSTLTQQLQTAIAQAPANINPNRVDIGVRQKLAAARTQLTGAQQRSSILSTDGAPGPEFQTLGQTVTASGGSSLIPSSVGARAGLAAVLGALLALVALAILTRADTRIRSREAAEAAFGFPVLAEVPQVGRRHRSLPVLAGSGSPAAAAYYGLEANLLELGPRSGGAHVHAGRIISVASPNSGDGRSSVAANVAACATVLEHRVIVVDADLRHRGIAARLGAPSSDASPGESEVSVNGTGGLSLSPVVPGLRLLGFEGSDNRAMTIVPRLRRMSDGLRSEADTIVVDTPPLRESPESILLVGLADSVVIVCRWGRTTRAAAWEMADQLSRTTADVAGVVIVGSPGGRYSASERTRRPAPAAAAGDRPLRAPLDGAAENRQGASVGAAGSNGKSDNGSSTRGSESPAASAGEIAAS